MGDMGDEGSFPESKVRVEGLGTWTLGKNMCLFKMLLSSFKASELKHCVYLTPLFYSVIVLQTNVLNVFLSPFSHPGLQVCQLTPLSIFEAGSRREVGMRSFCGTQSTELRQQQPTQVHLLLRPVCTAPAIAEHCCLFTLLQMCPWHAQDEPSIPYGLCSETSEQNSRVLLHLFLLKSMWLMEWLWCDRLNTNPCPTPCS